MRSRATIITSIVLFLAIVGGAFVGHNSSQKEGGEYKDKIAIINETSDLQLNDENVSKISKDYEFQIKKSDNVKDLKKKLEDNDIDGIVVAKQKNDTISLEYTYKSFADQQLKVLLSQFVQQHVIEKTIEEKKVAPEVATKLLTPIEVKDNMLTNTSKTFGVVYVLVLIMYIFIIMFGQSIAMNITAEKSSRVMEVLIPKVKPIVTMYAKVLSVLATAFTQFIVIIASFLLSSALGWLDLNQMKLFGFNVNLNELSLGIGIIALIYFVLGFILYAMMYACAGALVSRVEDLQNILMPIVFCIMAGFFIGMRSLADPTASIVVVGSYIPFFSPIVTLSRAVAGEASSIEIMATILILLGTIAILNKFASRVYVNGVMSYSEKVKLSDLKKFSKKQ